MKKGYSNRQMRTEEDELIEFSFPKHNPPVTVKARTREEAEAQLIALDNQKEV